MITIPTGDLVGIVSDVYPFASTIRDLPEVNAVQLRWDGEQLHALATDRAHAGWSTWDQDDEGDDDEQPELFETWGGLDKPWQITISRDDAKKLTDAFKLGTKKRWTPLSVEHLGDAVKVVRQKADDHAAITMLIADTGIPFPGDMIEKLIDEHQEAVATEHMRLSPVLLAHFAKVRPRGDFEVKFTGRYSPVLVTIGQRFTGLIMPQFDDDFWAAKRAAREEAEAAKAGEWDGDTSSEAGGE